MAPGSSSLQTMAPSRPTAPVNLGMRHAAEVFFWSKHLGDKGETLLLQYSVKSSVNPFDVLDEEFQGTHNVVSTTTTVTGCQWVFITASNLQVSTSPLLSTVSGSVVGSTLFHLCSLEAVLPWPRTCLFTSRIRRSTRRTSGSRITCANSQKSMEITNSHRVRTPCFMSHSVMVYSSSIPSSESATDGSPSVSQGPRHQWTPGNRANGGESVSSADISRCLKDV